MPTANRGGKTRGRGHEYRSSGCQRGGGAITSCGFADRDLNRAQRRRVVALGSLLPFIPLTALVACSERKAPQQSAAPSAATFSAEGLHSKLELLRLAYEAKGLKVTADLLLPLPADEVRALCQWFPAKLPDELLGLYSWHNGQRRNDSPGHAPFDFRDCAFVSVQDAEREYETMMRTYGANPPGATLLRNAFPFAAFENGWMVMPCQQQSLDPRFERPIISVFQGIEIFFYSVESMVDTCIDWVRDRKYDKGHLPQEEEMRIWRRNNPGIFAR
jgi:hypothetical protein